MVAWGDREPAETRWGDDEEGSDDGETPIPQLPSRYESKPDANGMKTVISYRMDDAGRKVKVTEQVRVTKKTVKLHKAVLARRGWAKFGNAKVFYGTTTMRETGYHGRGYQETGTTTLDISGQTLDLQPQEKRQEEESTRAQDKAFEAAKQTGFVAWRPKSKMTDQSDEGYVPAGGGGSAVDSAKAWAEQNLGGGRVASSMTGNSSLEALAANPGGARSAYVPPSMRNADGSRRAEGDRGDRDSSLTVRVSNLSEDVRDSDLRELFRRFGAIQRIYLAKDRETQQSRGFAFVNFYNREDGQKAIDKLNGHGYDHCILSVDWAAPSTK